MNLETVIRYLAELRGGDVVEVSCRLVFGEGKTYGVEHELRAVGGQLAAQITTTSGLLDLERRHLVTDPAARWRQAADRPEVLGL